MLRWFLALATAAWLAGTGQARADVDLTGNWVLVGTRPGGFTSFRQFTQTGTSLEVRGRVFGSEIVLTGTIDPATGAFRVGGVVFVSFGQCLEQITGVASPDGTIFTDDYTILCSPFEYFDQQIIEGRLCGTPGADCCGNGLVDAGEVCDGPCCPSCQALAVAGSACPDDGNVCTDDVCDAAGTCQHPDNTAPCTLTGVCDPAGVCSNGACEPTPCRAATASRVSIRSAPGLGRFPVRWSWRGVPGGTPSAVFGDPTATTEYLLCYEVPTNEYVERDAFGIFPGSPPSSPWTARATGYRYSAPSSIVRSLRLKASARYAKLAALTALIGPPPPITGPAHFRLVSKDLPGVCFEATFTSPRVNTPTHYSAEE